MTDCDKYIFRALIEYGMKNTLESLITACPGDEDYIIKLREDLQATLDNYNNRYKLPNRERTYKAIQNK